MTQQLRFPLLSWIPILAGLAWLWRAPTHGLPGFLASVLPGCLLLAAGTAMLLYPGDRRISQFGALGGLLGVVFALPAFFVVGPAYGLLLVAVSLAAFVASGAYSQQLEPEVEGVPPVAASIPVALQVAVDEALLSTITLTMPLAPQRDHARIEREASEARELFESKGWLEKPADYHVTPPPLEAPHRIERSLGRRLRFEHLSWESEYEPHPEEPGRERWLSYAPNRTAHAWVVRHQDGPRPWLVCIHGYQMGFPWLDIGAFPPPWLHERLGLNLVMPMLPLHGQRRIGRRSGDGFLAGELMDTLHAEANAVWDLRRIVSWARSQGAPAVGVMGYSLGGYNTALLASLEPELACAIAGIPAADFARLYYRHGPPLSVEDADRRGMRAERMQELFQVVSPLALRPKLARERRYIFAGLADRLVPPDQVRDLWRHWEEPAIQWYAGAHITFRMHPPVVRFISGALRASGLAS